MTYFIHHVLPLKDFQNSSANKIAHYIFGHTTPAIFSKSSPQGKLIKSRNPTYGILK